MSDETSDDQLIYEAAILAEMICAGETLAAHPKEEAQLILREMRAETECARLARRLARHFQSFETGSQ